jgi:hypothetical protein
MINVEFTTKLQQGNVAIPNEYLSQLEGKNLRIIILEDQKSNSSSLNREKFQAVHLDTKSFRFNRQEANER